MTQASLVEMVAAIRSGDRIISFPTDTVPALAARPDQAELIFTAKQRQPDKPLILMGATPTDLWPFVSGIPAEWEVWQQVVQQHWPGALTLVLPASQRVPLAMNPTDPSTIGLRVPNHAIAQAVLERTGPLATTSANLTGQPPLQTMAEIEAQFPEVLTLSPLELETYSTSSAPSPVNLASGTPSTVAKWTPTGWQILRQGAVQLS